MQTQKRSGYKWSVNECLRLEREYELLKLSVSEIALLHERSDEAIMYKLDQEGIADYNHLYVKKNPTMFLKEEQQDEDSDEEEKDSDDSSNYECSEEEQDDEEEQDEEQEETYNAYNLNQQVQLLTKQLANLTSIVYKSFLGKGKTAEMPFH